MTVVLVKWWRTATHVDRRMTVVVMDCVYVVVVMKMVLLNEFLVALFHLKKDRLLRKKGIFDSNYCKSNKHFKIACLLVHNLSDYLLPLPSLASLRPFGAAFHT